MSSVAAIAVLLVVLMGCSGGSSGSVAGTKTSQTTVDSLSGGASVPVNGLLTTLTFRRTCIRDAVDTICASLIPPGPQAPNEFLPALNLGEPVNGVVIRGKFPGHPNALTWSFVTNS